MYIVPSVTQNGTQYFGCEHGVSAIISLQEKKKVKIIQLQFDL